MRDVPALVHAVAAEAAAELVIQSAVHHLLQREMHDVPRLLVAGRMAAAQQQIELSGMQEFWRAAQSAMHAVEVFDVLLHRQCERRVIQRDHCMVRFGHGLGQCGDQVLALFGKFCAVLRIYLCHAFQQIGKGRQVVAYLFGKISPAEEWRAVRAQEHRQRPAAVALREQVMRGLVDLVEVGAFFAIHLDVDEMLVHHCGYVYIFKRFVRHHMAPVAGGITYREQDGFVLFAGETQCVRVPRMPVHRVVCMLLQIGAGFQ